MYLMPRKPSFRHPLRDLRAILGKEYTQKKLSRELGVSEVAIKRIENGTLRLSTEMKGRIAAFAGVDAESLDSGRFTVASRPSRLFSRAAFSLFRVSTRTRKMGEDKAQLHLYELRAQLRAIKAMKALTNAAADKNKFHVVIFLWYEWLHHTIRNFGLRNGFFECAKKQRVSADTLRIWQQLFKLRESTPNGPRLGRRRRRPPRA
jgi:transcriptional regulator with XRE-family HTH domain